MKILAFDSSSPVVSIAMINDDPFSKKEIILYHQDQSQPRTTSSIFFEELEKVIQKHGRPDRIVVGLGPGSYNGLRSSIATAQGMASSCGAELIGIPSIVAFEEGKKGCWVVGNARGGHYWLAQIIDHQCVRGPELFTLEELERGQSRSLLISGLEPKVNEPKLTNCGTDPKTNGLAPNMTICRTDPFVPLQAEITELTLPREAMGFGDVKFLACIGAFLGFKGALFSLFAGSLVGAIAGGLLLLITAGRSGRCIPFGPYLALGALIWFFFEPWIFGKILVF